MTVALNAGSKINPNTIQRLNGFAAVFALDFFAQFRLISDAVALLVRLQIGRAHV